MKNEKIDDLGKPEFKKLYTTVQVISSIRAEKGFPPSETASYIFPLRDALLYFLKKTYDDDPALLNREILKAYPAIDRMTLVIFESCSNMREAIIQKQSQSL